MKVKIGHRVYDGENEPVMVILSEKDKENIRGMDSSATKYCCAPDGMTEEDVKKFMKNDSNFDICNCGQPKGMDWFFLTVCAGIVLYYVVGWAKEKWK